MAPVFVVGPRVELPNVTATSGIPFFTNVEFFVLLTMFWTYGMAMSCFAIAISSCTHRTKSAYSMGFAIFAMGLLIEALAPLITEVMGTDLSYLFYDPQYSVGGIPHWVWLMYPPLGFSRIMADIKTETAESAVYDTATGVETVVPGDTFTFAHLYDGDWKYINANRTTMKAGCTDCTFHITGTIGACACEWGGGCERQTEGGDFF